MSLKKRERRVPRGLDSREYPRITLDPLDFVISAKRAEGLCERTLVDYA
ncbi:Uncharacterised protein [Paenibacillus macerans]|uniref:Integrase domain protein n=1 Tax=Paenibacillus macerans TaxID=44252 RepID=A0A090ZIY8_PAEMA|nr:integrase domain protein [Paenibacillus macerans]GBK64622.1 hypothetical protein PbDSM24746_46260 [Paenibacillus macerans]GBK70944.1 hypothetical protein PbJCM17693_46520 [Paenibacillus macerans]GIP13191.1 hypothetical protein J1TS5_53610 [Paenibacillus macerans]SUD26376.1 Uncharacterised protein [Paenibacillus macerans]